VDFEGMPRNVRVYFRFYRLGYFIRIDSE